MRCSRTSRTLSVRRVRGPHARVEGRDLTVAYLIARAQEPRASSPATRTGSWMQKVPLVGLTPEAPGPLVVKKGAQKQRVQDQRRLRRVQQARRRRGEDRELRARVRRLRRAGARVPVGRLQGPRRQRQDASSSSSTIRRCRRGPRPGPDDVRRQGDDLLRPLDLQVREGRRARRGRRAHRPRDRTGRISVLGGAGHGPANGSTWSRRTRTWAARASKAGSRWMPRPRCSRWPARTTRSSRRWPRRATSSPSPLGLTASIAIKQKMRTIDSQNVVGEAHGRDPVLQERIRGLHRALGSPGRRRTGQRRRIYNGALDNASGVAMVLEIARVLKQMPARPKRSILFLFVTAEEQGLLGSQYYASSRSIRWRRPLAVINVDGINQWGRTKDLTVVGLGASDLDDYAQAAAAEQGRMLEPGRRAGEGLLLPIRSLQLREEGRARRSIPIRASTSSASPPSTARRSATSTRTATTTRRPTRLSPTGISPAPRRTPSCSSPWAIASPQADKFPDWKPGNEFKAIRDKALGR